MRPSRTCANSTVVITVYNSGLAAPVTHESAVSCPVTSRRWAGAACTGVPPRGTACPLWLSASAAPLQGLSQEYCYPPLTAGGSENAPSSSPAAVQSPEPVGRRASSGGGCRGGQHRWHRVGASRASPGPACPSGDGTAPVAPGHPPSSRRGLPLANRSPPSIPAGRGAPSHRFEACSHPVVADLTAGRKIPDARGRKKRREKKL